MESPTVELPKEVDKKVRDVVVFLTYSSGIHLNAARIMKLAYLAELRAIETLGRRLTKAVFINYLYGAWSPDVALAMESVPELRIEVKKTSKGRKGRFFVPTQKKVSIASLSESEITLLKEVLAHWIHIENDRLVTATKTSPPFIWSKFGERIPFADYEDFAERLREAQEDKLEDVDTLESKEDIREFVKSLA